MGRVSTFQRQTRQTPWPVFCLPACPSTKPPGLKKKARDSSAGWENALTSLGQLRCYFRSVPLPVTVARLCGRPVRPPSQKEEQDEGANAQRCD